jgi:hypothetical protein
MKTLALGLFAMVFCMWGCKETIIEYRDTGTQPLLKVNDAYHGDIVGRIYQLQSNAVVTVSQVGPIDSAQVSPTDGSFALRYLQMGNYDLTIRADNYRIYLRTNVIVQGGGITYVGEIDLSKIPDLVSTVYPENGSEIVYDWRYGRITISILFTHPMDRASVEKSFSTYPASTGVFNWGQYATSPRSDLYADPANQLAGYDPGAVITTYSKVSSLTYSMARNYSLVDTQYTIMLSTDAKDTSGNHLRFPLVSTFCTVQSYVTYSGIQTNPVNGDIGVAPMNSGGISVTFPRRMDPSSTEAATAISPSMNKILLWPSGNVLTIYTGGPYLTDTTITVTIDKSAKDKDGIALGETFSFWFRTAALQVNSTYPSNAQLYIATNQTISIYFNSYVDKNSVQSAFSITPSIGGSFQYGNGNSYDSPNWITFTPYSTFMTNTKYTVTIGSSVRDPYGVNMKAPYSFSFVTRPN